jgi:hypothetical protein
MQDPSSILPDLCQSLAWTFARFLYDFCQIRYVLRNIYVGLLLDFYQIFKRFLQDSWTTFSRIPDRFYKDFCRILERFLSDIFRRILKNLFGLLSDFRKIFLYSDIHRNFLFSLMVVPGFEPGSLGLVKFVVLCDRCLLSTAAPLLSESKIYSQRLIWVLKALWFLLTKS